MLRETQASEETTNSESKIFALHSFTHPSSPLDPVEFVHYVACDLNPSLSDKAD